MKARKILVCVVFLFIGSCLFVSQALAGIRIDKPKVRLSVAPGSYDSGEIKVENNGAEPIAVKVYLEDWIYRSPDGEKEFMPKGTHALSCASWITFYPADFTLAVNGHQMVRYTVSVPQDARGGYYAVMFFETGGGEVEKLDEYGHAMTVKILHRLGALFYVEPENTVQKSAEVRNLDLSQNLNRLTVVADFLNTGNTDIAVGGNFDIIDIRGYVYARGAFERVYTLPQGRAQLRAVVPATHLNSGTYDIVLTLDYENGGTLIKEGVFHVESSGAIASLTLKD